MLARLALLLLLVPAAAQARCPGETTLDMRQCAGDRLAAADAALNATYRTVAARVANAPEARAGLVAAERAWVAFRDAECGFLSSGVAGGSIQPVVYTDCKTERTRQREAELKALLHCREGDLSCPVPP